MLTIITMFLLVFLTHANADSSCWKHARHRLKVSNHSPYLYRSIISHTLYSYSTLVPRVRDVRRIGAQTLKVVRVKNYKNAPKLKQDLRNSLLPYLLAL
jgi:hypothetical protein